MFDRCFDFVYDFVERRKPLLLFVVFVILSAGIWGLFLVKFDSDIGLMVPKHEVISRNINFFRNSNVSGKIVISLGLTSPEKGSKALFNAVDNVVSSLDPKLFPEVTKGISGNKMGEASEVLFKNMPKIFSESDLSIIDGRINKEYISEKLRTSYIQMLKPGGVFFSSMVRSDPLGLNGLVLEKLKELQASTGFVVKLKDDHFVSKDGMHALIIAKTPIQVTDTSGTKDLFISLSKTLDKLPEYISADIICGHSHTLSNEQIIKKDIRLTLSIASILFLILFVVVIGDISAILIYMIPLISIIASINLSYLLVGNLSFSVIGLGAVVAGISVDYGIHIYIAARRGKNPAKAVKHVAKPVIIGGLTTTGIFFAFFFSSIEGYHQMAIFSIISIILALILATVALPHLLPGKRRDRGLKNSHVEVIENLKLSNNITVFIWALLTIVLAWFSLSVGFDSRVSAMDGTSKDILEAEERFKEVWGQEKLAVLVTEAKNYENVLELNEKIYNEAAIAIGTEHFSNLASLWPSAKTRKENFSRWKQFWAGDRKEKLKKLLQQEGVKFRFSDSAFDPFFKNIYADANEDRLSTSLFERFIQKKENGYQVLSYFPDKKEYVSSMSAIIRNYPGAYLVSGNVMSEIVSEVITSDIKKMTIVAAAFVIILTVLFLGNIVEAAIALVPVLTSVIWLLGIVSALGVYLNVASLVAYIVAMGLCVDYGIFMVYKSRKDIRTGTVLAVTLSAISTLMGAGVLLFAKHPALLSIGTTMVIGVGAGYLSSLFVVPRLHELLVAGKGRK